jgi:hypothetical protein
MECLRRNNSVTHVKGECRRKEGRKERKKERKKESLNVYKSVSVLYIYYESAAWTLEYK